MVPADRHLERPGSGVPGTGGRRGWLAVALGTLLALAALVRIEPHGRALPAGPAPVGPGPAAPSEGAPVILTALAMCTETAGWALAPQGCCAPPTAAPRGRT